MNLSDDDRRMLGGESGPAAQKALSILVQLGEMVDASDLLDITRAHVDGCTYQGESYLDFAEMLAHLGGRVRVLTTLNATSLELRNWQSWGVDPAWAGKAARLAQAYIEMGCIPTWTCSPYQTEHLPHFGEQIAWAESNAIVFANSIIGARTNRYGDFTDICAALTGRVPRVGLHLTENRRGQMLIDLTGLAPALMQDDAFYPVLGHYLGKRAGDFIPVLLGLPSNVREDSLKALGAGASSSGGVALFHAVGITPEAPTLEAAFGGRAPLEQVRVVLSDLAAARADLSSADGTRLDAVVLGSPHFSLAESLRLVEAIAGRRIHPSVEFIVTTGRAVKAALAARGLLAALTASGVRLCEDTCILLSPLLRAEIRVLMTNSAKYAYYSPGLLDRRVVFGSLQDCVDSAVAGRVIRSEELWV